ncbi:MAG: hypothetical protein ABR985_18510 [Methanotrichaceae archaeon]
MERKYNAHIVDSISDGTRSTEFANADELSTFMRKLVGTEDPSGMNIPAD